MQPYLYLEKNMLHHMIEAGLNHPILEIDTHSFLKRLLGRVIKQPVFMRWGR